MSIEKIEANSPEAQSANILADNLAQLKALFPELVTEGANGAAINVDVLKALVGDQTVTDADEKYGLNWHGKKKARQIALTPSTGTLRPCPEESVDWDTTQNLMIEGDNLEVLKLLQKSYAGKVKLIYIDPPYNTGKDFVYPDNFQDNIKNYLELTSQVDGGQKLSSNTEASGRFHTDWLNLMYPRLKLAHSLLNSDGVIFISIDDHEVDNLRKVCSEIFGEECFRANIVWRRTVSAAVSGQGFAVAHDHILVYSKQSDTEFGRLPVTDELDYKNPDTDPRGPYKLQKLERTLEGDRPSMTFEIQTPVGPITKTWAVSPQKFKELLDDNRIAFSKGGLPYYKQFLSEYKGRLPDTWWAETGGFNQNASRELKELFGEKDVFNNPKPLQLLNTILQIGCPSEGIVLDFFAGSGTTGHAVIAQNAIDGGKRRYVLVQLPEPLNASDESIGTAFCDRLNRPRNIAELTKERLRRAGKRVTEETPLFTGDCGFRVFKLDTSNIRAWNPTVNDLKTSLFDHLEHLEAGRSSDDILYEILLKLGLDLCVPIEKREIAGKQVNSVGAGVLMACLVESIKAAEVEALALGMVAWREEQGTVGDTTAVFRDSAFENDVAKSNLAAILEQHGIKQVRSL